jgi:hypothetical protein
MIFVYRNIHLIIHGNPIIANSMDSHTATTPDSYSRLYHGDAEIIRKSHKQVGNYYHPTMYMYDEDD